MNHKNNNFTKTLLAGAVASIMLTGCGGSSSNSSSGSTTTPSFPAGAIMLPKTGLTQAAKEAFITAADGAVIVFPEGTHLIEDTLTFDGDADGDGDRTENITIMGYGAEATILDFSSSIGGDGIFVQNAKNITFKNLSVEEAANNAIKLKDTDGILIQNTHVQWKGDLSSDNGAYGFYPVESSNIVIEDSYVRGSADAGIYVGQSQNIVVRNNTAEENVAGIEIENSINADVYNNIADGNTGGILVFDLPIGNGHYGNTVRIFNNTITNNNTDNFANSSANPAGVHIVPPGTGVIVLSTRDVEIYNNTITGNETTAIAISSFFLADADVENYGTTYGAIILDGWKPVPRNIALHDNTISGNGSNPRGTLIEEIIAGYSATAGSVPNILYDGLGELLANAGAIAAMGEVPFAVDGSDNICAASNGEISLGSVYQTDPTAEGAFDESGQPQAVLLFENPQASLLSCDSELAGLPANTATIGDTTYGCGADDNGSACQL